MALYENAMLFQRAPEICIEICVPDGEEKAAAYLAAGAQEVWLVSQEGTIRYVGPLGEMVTSGFPVTLSLPPPIKRQP